MKINASTRLLQAAYTGTKLKDLIAYLRDFSPNAKFSAKRQAGGRSGYSATRMDRFEARALAESLVNDQWKGKRVKIKDQDCILYKPLNPKGRDSYVAIYKPVDGKCLVRIGHPTGKSHSENVRRG